MQEEKEKNEEEAERKRIEEEAAAAARAEAGGEEMDEGKREKSMYILSMCGLGDRRLKRGDVLNPYLDLVIGC